MTTHATGWHTHAGEHEIHYDFKPCAKDDRVPVLVIDPAAARDVIARALWSEQGYGTPFERLDRQRREGFLMLADAILAALETTP